MLGMIVRMDKSGLGVQSRRLYRMLKPDKIMLIDSTPFNGNSQHPEWYEDHNNVIKVHGFPTEEQIIKFLENIGKVITAESFYSNEFVRLARSRNVKTIHIYNYEFLDNLKYHSLEVADVLIQPSLWKAEEMAEFGSKYIPTPIFEEEFIIARETNLQRTSKMRYLFLNGKTAIHDRNGLNSLYDALKYTNADFEVVVKSQGEVSKTNDPRVTYDSSNPNEQYKLYENFDALIMPRRYGGQCLPMNEALLSGLPVVMTDIEPNNLVLPKEWLVSGFHMGTFMTRTEIDLYSADPYKLAEKLELGFTTADKLKAVEIGRQYEAGNLKECYKELIK